MKTQVIIQGPVSAMKSPMANRIKDAIDELIPDLSCRVFDHSLFTFSEDFEDHLAQVKQKAEKYDVSVIVIGTGTKNGHLTIQIEPALPGSAIIFNAVTDFIARLNYPESQ